MVRLRLGPPPAFTTPPRASQALLCTGDSAFRTLIAATISWDLGFEGRAEDTCPKSAWIRRVYSQHLVSWHGFAVGKCDSMGSRSLSVNRFDPNQRRRRAPACGAAVEAWTATTKIAFTESEGDPQYDHYRKEDGIGGACPHVRDVHASMCVTVLPSDHDDR